MDTHITQWIAEHDQSRVRTIPKPRTLDGTLDSPSNHPGSDTTEKPTAMTTLARPDPKESMRLSFRADMEKVSRSVGGLPVVDLIHNYNSSPTSCAERHRSTSLSPPSHFASVMGE